MRVDDLTYTINEDYYIIIRLRKCYNTFRLRLMYKNERIEEICCPQNQYNVSMETLINLVK